MTVSIVRLGVICPECGEKIYIGDVHPPTLVEGKYTYPYPCSRIGKAEFGVVNSETEPWITWAERRVYCA